MGDMKSESSRSSGMQGSTAATNVRLPGPGGPARRGQNPKNVSYVAHITNRQSEL